MKAKLITLLLSAFAGGAGQVWTNLPAVPTNPPPPSASVPPAAAPPFAYQADLPPAKMPPVAIDTGPAQPPWLIATWQIGQVQLVVDATPRGKYDSESTRDRERGSAKVDLIGLHW